MTLTEIRATFPDLFYRQDWFNGEAFMQREPIKRQPFFHTSEVPPFADESPIPVHAVDLAALYVRDHENPIWRKFLWTDDVDRYGNRVYVAGVGMYGCDGFQIHRKLEPAAWWVRFM